LGIESADECFVTSCYPTRPQPSCAEKESDEGKETNIPAPPRPVDTIGAGFFKVSLKKVEILLPALPLPLVEFLSPSFVTAAMMFLSGLFSFVARYTSLLLF